MVIMLDVYLRYRVADLEGHFMLGYPNTAAYSASKFAVRGLVHSAGGGILCINVNMGAHRGTMCIIQHLNFEPTRSPSMRTVPDSFSRR